MIRTNKLEIHRRRKKSKSSRQNCLITLSLTIRRNPASSLREYRDENKFVVYVKIPPRDLMLLAIFKIFPSRSFGWDFFGEAERIFFTAPFPIMRVVLLADDELPVGVTFSWCVFRLESVGVESERTKRFQANSSFNSCDEPSLLIFFFIF